MKNLGKFAFCILFVFQIYFLQAQDFIYKTDGTKIECIVKGMNSSVVTFTTSNSDKSQSVNINQTAVIIFENGQYITLPTSDLKFENAKNAVALGNDVVIDRFAEPRVGTILNLSKTEIEFNDAESGNLLKITGDEVVLAIYNRGDHVFFRNAPDVKALLEYVQPKIYALAEKQAAAIAAASAAEKPAGRPSYITDNTQSKVVTNPTVENENLVEAEPVKLVEQNHSPVEPIKMGNSSNMSQEIISNSSQNEAIIGKTSSDQPGNNKSNVIPINKSDIIPINKSDVIPTNKSDVILTTKSTEYPVGKSNSAEIPRNTSRDVESDDSKIMEGNNQNSAVYEGESVFEAPTDSVWTESSKTPQELNDIDFEEFSDKALQKIDDFTNYLSIIASKETVPESANQAIELAVELFVDENVVVEVTTAGFAESVKRKIRDYLVRLKLLKYDRVEIQWADINYVSNFRKAPDGNYYGSITVKQTFRGYKDNQVVYSDVTQKDVEVVIKGMEKSIQGKKEMVWDVLLSDIGVLDTK